MATLGEVNPVSVPNLRGKTIFIEPAHRQNEIVITVEKKRIVVYNFADRQITADWTVSGNQLSCPAVMYGEPPWLAVAFNKTTVITWERYYPRVEKGKKTTMDQTIYRLWVPVNRSCPYIIYYDGSLSSVDKPSIKTLDAQLPKTAQIVWNGHTAQKDCNVFCLVYEDQNKGILCLVYDWQSSTDIVTCTKHALSSNLGIRLTSYSLCQYRNHVYLFVLQGASVVQKVCVFDRRDSSQHVMKPLSTLPTEFELCDINALDDHQVAVVCKQTSDALHGVGIWDTKFALMHSFKTLGKENSCKWLYRIDRWLFIGCTDGLFACTFTPFTATLVAAVGMVKPGSQMVTSSATPTLKSDLTEIRQLLHNLADITKTPKAKNFHAMFTSFADWLCKSSPGDLDNLNTEINGMIQRIAEEKYFWPEQVVFQTLLAGHVLQGSHLTLLMPALIDHKETEIIYQLLKVVSYVPESVAVQALSYFIRILPKLDANEMDVGGDLNEYYTQQIYRENDAEYINTILNLPYNDIFMVQSLRQMEFVHIIDLLKYLSSLLSSAPASPLTAAAQNTPTLSQVFDWCCMCIDAHLSQLMISAEAKPIILTLNEQVKQQVSFFKELGSLDSILKQLKDKWKQKPKHAAKYYCIQTLHIY